MTIILCVDCMNEEEETPDYQIFECSDCGRDDCLMEIANNNETVTK